MAEGIVGGSSVAAVDASARVFAHRDEVAV